MGKTLVKKRKLKIFNLLIVLVVLAGIVFSVYLYLQIPIKNIIIKNNKYLTDDYILDLAKIRNYPEYYKYSSGRIEKNIKKSNYIDDVKVKRSFFHTIEITITDSNFVIFRVPRVLNYIPNDKYKRFINGMDRINDDTLSKISDIVYDPNDIDTDRFLLYMDDGNMVYLTLTKFKMINYYNTVLEQLENRKGVLYLDNGNHFQIKE